MKLFLTDIKDVSLERVNQISAERALKVKRLKNIDDKKRCIAGGLMINCFLNNDIIRINPFGKPFAESGSCFNLSHSGDYVLFALSECSVGCDIEKIKFVNAEKIGKIVFCSNETEKIKSSSDKTGIFYDLWTKKESLLKCIGEGFHRNAKSVDVSKNIFSENGINYYLKTWHFSDYVISVCSENNDFPQYIEFIDFNAETNKNVIKTL